jgi:K+-sensing histidine kinase KdpD
MNTAPHDDISTRNRILLVVGCLLVSLAIDAADARTGEQYDFFAFYFIPISIAAWWAGRGSGILIALVSAAAWFQSDFLAHRSYSYLVGSWDTLMRGCAFLLIAMAVSKVKSELLRERRLRRELADAMSQIKQLQGILPMCSFCRKIRDQSERWVPMEKYIAEHSDARVSHGLCPACYRKHYGDPNGT